MILHFFDLFEFALNNYRYFDVPKSKISTLCITSVIVIIQFETGEE